MVGAPLDWAKEGSRFRVQGCGGGFAANIYGAMPESGIQATSPQSLATHPCFHTSGLWWRLRCILDDGFPRIVSLPLEGKVPRRGG